jgi:titin
VAGAAISDYVIQYSADLGPWTPYRTVDDGESTATTHTVGGLIAGTHYAFHVAAVNATGVGWWSDTVEVTPRGEPAAPAGLNGAVAPAAGVGSGEVRLGWTAPDDDGGVPVTDYVVERSTDGTTWTPVDDGISTATMTTVGGLTNGTPYQLRVAAVNPVGQGPWSDVVLATPVWTPAGPASLGAASGIASGEVRLTWSVPIDDGGVPVTDYVVERSTDGTTWTSADGRISTATTTSVRGLTNGARYRFRVAALNALGQGSWSESAIATPRWKPAAPRLRATAARSLQVKLTWTAPTSNGAPITDYVIQRSTGKRWTTVRDGISTARSLVITRLTDGVAYRFRVAAVNAVGRGLWSASVQATPRAR